MLTRVVVAPSGFKESLSAQAAADAIADGVQRVLPDVGLDLIPLVDGGEGTAAALAAATGGGSSRCPPRARWAKPSAPTSRCSAPGTRRSWKWPRWPASPSSPAPCATRAPPRRTASAS